MNEQNIVVRDAQIDEIDAIVAYIRDHYYAKNHVYTRHRELLLAHHFVHGKLCFTVAIDSDTDEICGIAGYFPSNSTDNPTVFVSMLQTTQKGNALLGIQLIQKAEESCHARVLMSSGVVKRIMPLYKFLGYKTGQLKHFYRCAEKPVYKIAEIHHWDCPASLGAGANMVLMTSIQQVDSCFNYDAYRSGIPFKDRDFIASRYFDNLGYHYQVYGISIGGNVDALLIGREALYDDAKAFKIIDYIGNAKSISECGLALGEIIDSYDYEYMDFYEYGIPDEYLIAAGFIELTKSDCNIIPHYFEPFERVNIDINYFVSTYEDCVVTRADGGQDRPNYL